MHVGICFESFTWFILLFGTNQFDFTAKRLKTRTVSVKSYLIAENFINLIKNDFKWTLHSTFCSCQSNNSLQISFYT